MNENHLRELRPLLGYSLYQERGAQESWGSAERPAFQQFFRDAYQLRFEVVLFGSRGRFSHESVTEAPSYLQKLTAAGVQVKSFAEQYFSSTGMFWEAISAV